MAFKILDKTTAETLHCTNDQAKAVAVALKYKSRGRSIMILRQLPNTRFTELKLAS